MAEQKSKYLVWLETLHREYTERTCITQLGRQAASLHLLADMYEVRCRFERIHERLQQEAIPLDDKGLNYMEWYNPEKWKLVETKMVDEDMRATLGIQPNSPLAQTYANSLLTPFGENASFDADKFRYIVSSLFVFDQIVDKQRMEVAIEEELKKLQSVLLNISNAKERNRSNEEYAQYFKNERKKYLNQFMVKATITNKHKSWLNNIDGEMNKEEMSERRAALLLEIFDSGFLDDLKKEYHRKANDVLGFKNYDFEKWNDRMDDAIKYFAALCKLCPFEDDMIDLSHDDRLGRYIINHHIERSIMNTFLEKMELINLVQKEMRKLDNPDEVVEEKDNTAELFVKRVTHIILKAQDRNGEPIEFEDNKHNKCTYVFNIAGRQFEKVMNELLNNYPEQILDYLDGASGDKALGVTKVCSFIGRVIKMNIFNDKDIRNIDFEPAFSFVYGEKNAQGKKPSYIQKMSAIGELKDKRVFQTIKTLSDSIK